jgi:ABC-2 type transport system ATP-binding protein
MSILLKILHVTKYYDKHLALDDVSLDLYKGEIITLLGANGAGKTTLSSIIVTLHPLTSGQVLYQDQSIYKDVISYRKILGFCPQKPNFSSGLTIYEHLLFAGRYFLMDTKKIKERVSIIMKRFGLDAYADKSPSILSGGYKQRLLIARALIHEPSLIILDEPTVALDPHIRHELWDIIKQLKKDGATVLLTTHYIDEAEVLSDRVCVLDKGKVKLIDTPKNLMATYNKVKLEDVFLQLMSEESEAASSSTKDLS